ncbi:hypothetical protein HMPREF3038_02908 [Akkermansia sp. KLE1797]|nr:hypothetical protein HMPREF3038_02908 [Akkermansia sp. KLE1797]KZA04054.1 hypothetical protein HMPREF1326_02250 [Akkermansia sp. KLE1605]
MRQENEPEGKTPSSHSNPVNFFPGLICYGHPVQQAEQHLIGMTSFPTNSQFARKEGT